MPYAGQMAHALAALAALAAAFAAADDNAAYVNPFIGTDGNGHCNPGATRPFAMGFYPVNPAAAEYVAGEPLFSRMRLSLPEGRTLEIRKGGAPGITLGGNAVRGAILAHADLVKGGVLEFGPEPAR